MKLRISNQIKQDFKDKWNSLVSDEQVKHIATQLSKHC